MIVHLSEDAASMSAGAAEWVTDYIVKHLTANRTFTWLLSGGNTPLALYQLLAASPYREQIEWNRLHIFFGDERFVPFDDPANNGKMAFDHLLSIVPVSHTQVHYIRTGINETDAVKQYEALLHSYFDGNTSTFDLALLGMGNDAHTLSLFPKTGTIYEQDRWVIPVIAPVEPAKRITLTTAVTLPSRCIAFLVSGSSKSPAIEHVLLGDDDPDLYPSQIFIKHSNLHLFADRDAMHLVNLKTS